MIALSEIAAHQIRQIIEAMVSVESKAEYQLVFQGEVDKNCQLHPGRRD